MKLDKNAIVSAAGIGCGPICPCATAFAESLSDGQVAMLAKIMVDTAQRSGTEVPEPLKGLNSDELADMAMRDPLVKRGMHTALPVVAMLMTITDHFDSSPAPR